MRCGEVRVATRLYEGGDHGCEGFGERVGKGRGGAKEEGIETKPAKVSSAQVKRGKLLAGEGEKLASTSSAEDCKSSGELCLFAWPYVQSLRIGRRPWPLRRNPSGWRDTPGEASACGKVAAAHRTCPSIA